MTTGPTLDVAPPQLGLVLGLLASRLPGADVFAFGSRVRHWPFGRGSKPYSDLDLAVWPAHESDPDLGLALAELRADLEDSALPWRVDVSLARDLPELLQEMARQQGVNLMRAAEHVT